MTLRAAAAALRPEPDPGGVASLVDRAQRGDRAALAEIYATYRRTVRGILLARARRVDVDDLVQDVFLVAMERLSSLRDPAAFPAWLAAIARNRATDSLRSSARTTQLPADLPVADVDRTEALLVLAAIRSLPEAYSETLTLRLVEGMTGPEIAARTGLTEGSVRVNLHRGMQKLREKLEKDTRVTNDYLWDRTGLPDPDIVRLERLLSQLRPAADGPRLLMFPARAQTSRPSWAFVAAVASLAAVIMAIVGVSWRSVQVSAGLDVTRLDGTPMIGTRPVADHLEMRAGTWLETNDQGRASIDIASVGRVDVDPQTRIGLVSSRPGQHRLQLQRGTIHALIWAPPGQFVVVTPSSTAVDLGCAYTLTVDDEGVGHVRVTSGWVGFEWRGRESFIPAGAVCETRVGLGPGTPHFDDTSAAFNEALAVLDLPGGAAEARRVALDRVIADARPRDAMTLWHLLSRLEGADRARVFDRLAALAPPPPGVTRNGVLAGQRTMLDDWWDTLGLGAANWWRVWKQQWRDGR